MPPVPSPSSSEHRPHRPFTLVLAGGGARGFAHVGVLRALEADGYRPSALVGVSMGAAVSVGYALRPVGIAFALCGLAMAVFQRGAVGWLSGRLRVRVQIALGFGMLGVGLLLLPFLSRAAAVYAAVSLLAIGVAFVTPNLLTLAADRSGPRAGMGLGLLNTAGGLGQTAGPLQGSLLFAWQPRLPFLVAGRIALAVGAWSLRRRPGLVPEHDASTRSVSYTRPA